MPSSIYLLTPLTDAAREWIAEHLPDDVQRWGPSVAIGHRYVEDIVCGMIDDGLTLGTDFTVSD